MDEYPIVALHNLCKSFEGVQALKNIDFSIYPGEIHCLAGENGSGKSTLIKVISGVHSPDSGTIEFGTEKVRKISPREAIAHGIQVIYQDFSIFPNLTVAENLALNAQIASGKKIVKPREIRQVAREALERIGITLDIDARVSELSVADKQLIAIARALVSDAKLIIMDEATTALTRNEVKTLFKLILDLKHRGIAILFVSHKLEEVFEIAEKFTILRSGEKIITCQSKELDRRSFSKYMTGRDFDEQKFHSDNVSEKISLKVSNLSSQGSFRDISFDLHQGEILGVAGLLGSGRTELARALFGLDPVTGGSLEVSGKNLKIKSVSDAVEAGIAYVPEDRLSEGLFLTRSIGENIVVSVLEKFSTHFGFLNKTKMAREEKEWVKELSIATPDPSFAVNTLSGGNQQKVVLAKWLATHPEILILNGPTVGVDIGSKYTIHAFIKRLADSGISILMISDDLPELLETCNRILVMKKGRIVASCDTHSTTQIELNSMISDEISEIES